MSKTVYVNVSCEKCSKIRRVNKYSHGKLCRACSTKETGAVRKGTLGKRKNDLKGRIFGQLTAVRPSQTKSRNASWVCKCTCGKEINVATCKLLYNGQHSCGCHKLTQNGYAKTRTYKSWSSMVRRCTVKASNRWHIYGGRGIIVCKRWLDFSNFLKDMGERPVNTSLDRINVNGDYCKKNCRWATRKEQARNRRNNRLITAFGQTHPVCVWAEKQNIKAVTIEWRLDHGFKPKDALTKKVKDRKKRRGLITAFGKTQSLSKWGKEIGIDRNTLARRLDSGLKPEQALTKKKRQATFLTLNGITKSITEWANLKKIKAQTLCGRLSRGLSLEDALKLPFKNK